jgi:hypothetical protein
MFEDILNWPETKDAELNDEDMKVIAEEVYADAGGCCGGSGDDCCVIEEEECGCTGCAGCGH